MRTPCGEVGTPGTACGQRDLPALSRREPATGAASPPPAQEARIQAEKRLQQVEARQAEAERQLAALAAAVDAAAGEAAAGLDELRGATKAMLSEFVARIADQFDALQAALEEAAGARGAEAEERAAAAAATTAGLEAQRAWVEERATALADRVAAGVEEAARATAAVAEAQAERSAAALQQAQQEAAVLRSGLEAAEAALARQQADRQALAEQLEQQAQQLVMVTAAQEAQAAAISEAQLAAKAAEAAAQSGASEAATALLQRVDALAEQQAGEAKRQNEAEGLLRQALTVWQRGLEEQMAALEGRLASQAAAALKEHQQLTSRFQEYRGYVKRLRREVAEARAEQGEATGSGRPPDLAASPRAWNEGRQHGRALRSLALAHKL